jgi:hypothetical protein
MPEIVHTNKDGSVTVRFTKQDAIQVRDDLGQIMSNEVSEAGDKLHSLLNFIHPAEPGVPW